MDCEKPHRCSQPDLPMLHLCPTDWLPSFSGNELRSVKWLSVQRQRKNPRLKKSDTRALPSPTYSPQEHALRTSFTPMKMSTCNKFHISKSLDPASLKPQTSSAYSWHLTPTTNMMISIYNPRLIMKPQIAQSRHECTCKPPHETI